MEAKYLNCSFQGSYYVPCEVLKFDFPKSEIYFSSIEKMFGCEEKEFGFVIRYFDDIEEDFVTRWVKKGYVKFPPISEWIGM